MFVVKPGDGVLVGALAATRSAEELWGLAQAVARAACVREREEIEEGGENFQARGESKESEEKRT